MAKMAENLETKARKAVLGMYEILKDVGMKLTHIIERKFDYYTMPRGIDYE